jgi:hypothetical protein
MSTITDAQRVLTTNSDPRAVDPRIVRPRSLPLYRVNLMRAGYLLMGVGLAVTRWPVMLHDPATLPLIDGIVAAILTAMSLLAFLGLRYPIKLLPLLLFETTWKLLWLAAVALPHLVPGDVDPAFGRTLLSIALVVVIIAVTPWDHVWRAYVRAPGDPWRGTEPVRLVRRW